MNRRSIVVRTGASTAVAALIAMSGAAPAAAAEEDVAVVNTETVQVYMSPTGEVTESRIYEQMSFTGYGSVSLDNPVSGNGVRNLDDFGGFDVEDGSQHVEVEVEGKKRLRGVSEYDDGLPLEVDVDYILDGESVEPGDVVGESGELEVQYRVENVTAKVQEISFADGKGNTITKQAEVVIPMVGSLSTTLPSSFTDVQSDEANQAGDGRGGTKLSFTMTLFEPIGSSAAEFGYTATITGGVVPPASIAALPVNPLESPSFKGGAESYEGGADTGAELTAGGQEIDENLLKLRDGAGDLLAGLIQLRNGSQQLSDGLNNEAGPGSVQLADGAGELADGLGLLQDGGALLASKMGEAESGAAQLADGSDRLAAGLGQLDDGGGRLADGSNTAADGADRLADGAGRLADGLNQAESKAPALIDGLKQVKGGLEQVDGGLAKMYGGIGNLPAKAKPLHDGIQQLIDGIGSKTSDGTLLFGVDQVRLGLMAAEPKIQEMADGVWNQTPGQEPGAYQKLGCALKTLDAIQNGGTLTTDDPCFVGKLPVPIVPVAPDDDPVHQLLLGALIPELAAGRDKLATEDGAMNDTTLYGGLLTLKGRLGSDGALGALTRIECGLSSGSLPGFCDLNEPGLLEGLKAVDLGVTQLVDGVVSQIQGGVGTGKDVPADKTLRGGVNGLQDGVDQIAAGGATLLEGLGQLSDGADQVAGGTGELSGGLDELAAGADRLTAGANDASSGADQLAAGNGELLAGIGLLREGAETLAQGAGDAEDGGNQVADGAQQLADGLGDATTGSSQITDGLKQAARGAPKLENGAQRLSDEGTKKLVEAGSSTAQEFGEKYALIEAGAERAQSEAMVFGAPEGAAGATAFTYELVGDDGESGRNWTRGVAAVVLFGLGAGVLLLRRGAL